MLCFAHSVAIFWVNIFKPPFAAAYAPTVFLPNSLIIEQILIILPCFFAIMVFTTCFDTMNGLTKSTLITSLKSSTSISSKEVRLIIPALFTSISIEPTLLWMSFIALITSSSFVTLNLNPYASMPKDL